jgi:uncharacterized protein
MRRAEWLLLHGANANGVHADSKRRLRDEALVNGDDAMAGLLLQHGAAEEPLQGIAAFQVACRRLDRSEALRLSQAHPEFLRDCEVMLTAVRQRRLDIIELLLELGMDVDIETIAGFRPLHSAAAAGAIDIVNVLIAHGADVDHRADSYGGPMAVAAHYGRRDVAKVLAPRSRDVHSLVHLGMKDRLEELFTSAPELADLLHCRTGQVPLFCLPDDESSALEMARFLLDHGANVGVRDKQGNTAVDAARRRGFGIVAEFLADALKRH